MNLFQIVFIPLLAGMAVRVLLQTLHGQTFRRHGLLWLALWLGSAMLIAFPDASLVVAHWLGIGRGSDLVFYFAIIGGLVAFRYFHRSYRRLEIRVTELIRLNAMEKPERGGERSDSKSGRGEPRPQGL
jgi:hypothetical protein